MSSKKHYINFSVEQKEVGLLLFSEVKTCPKNVNLVAGVNRMSACSGVFVSYESFFSTYQKRGLSYTILCMAFSSCCNSKQYIRKLIM